MTENRKCPVCGTELKIGKECFIQTKESQEQRLLRKKGFTIRIGDCEKCKIGYVC